jgi:hypothetical protein
MKVLAALLAIAVLPSPVPTTWAQADAESLELPAANLAYSAIHLDPSAYNRIPERVIYRNYPVYAPGPAEKSWFLRPAA